MKFIHILLILLFSIAVLYQTLDINFFVSSLQPDPIESVLDKTRKKLTAKYGWHPIGTLVSSPEGRLRRLGLHFQVQGPIPKDDIRKFLITATQTLEKYIMKECSLKDVLTNYPTNENNVEIVLFFIDESLKTIVSPNIGIADCSYGKLSYTSVVYVYDSTYKRSFSEYVSHEKESYDEALQALGLPPRNCPPPLN